ncbi:MAG: hypothetical protein HDR88_14230 [Bacteroides sp.]|nr:hypothetical protein [Bacteroides sp.]
MYDDNRKLNPFTDIGFKHIFGMESSKQVLIDFLNALLEDEPMCEKIVDLEHLTPEYMPVNDEYSRFMYDVNCRTETGRNILVEIQRKVHPNFRDRMTVYSAAAVIERLESKRHSFKTRLQELRQNPGWPSTEQENREEMELIERSNSYKIDSVYTIALCNFVIDLLRPWYKLSEGRCDLHTKELVDDLQRFIYIQLPLFKKSAHECETSLDRWIYSLKHLPKITLNPFAADYVEFERLMIVSDPGTLTEKERRIYKKQLDDFITTREYKRYAHAEGREDGVRIMLEQAVRTMRANGLDNPTIARFLNASVELVASI